MLLIIVIFFIYMLVTWRAHNKSRQIYFPPGQQITCENLSRMKDVTDYIWLRHYCFSHHYQVGKTNRLKNVKHAITKLLIDQCNISQSESITSKLLHPFQSDKPIKNYCETETSNLVVFVVPYHSLQERLSLFLGHFSLLMQDDPSIRLVISALETDSHTISTAISSLSPRVAIHINTALQSSKKFSRGRLLNWGAVKAMHTYGSRHAIFFCDVDVFVTSAFLERCRIFSSSEHSAYFPIFWTERRPKFMDAQNFEDSRFGFWRQTSYGMSCIRGGNFKKTKGFLELSVWGKEDVLYFKSLQNMGFNLIRYNDPGVVHKWHPITCNDAPTKLWDKLTGAKTNCQKVRERIQT